MLPASFAFRELVGACALPVSLPENVCLLLFQALEKVTFQESLTRTYLWWEQS